MNLCLVPMKPLDRAKERLAEALSADDRRALSLSMLTDVVAACSVMDEVWVLNSDGDAADAARAAGATPVADPTPDQGLNASLNAATRLAADAGAVSVLIVSADLPAIRADDVRAMILGEGIALAPNRYGTGTNALWRRPADLIDVYYGSDSRRAHQGLAFARGIPCAIVTRQALALDVDAPRDLDDVMALGPGDATRATLNALGYPRNGRR